MKQTVAQAPRSEDVTQSIGHKHPAKTPIQETLDLIGKQVRNARRVHTMSRRELSALSGVSMRHLAQLENGGGNISVALLKRIADAMSVSLGQLVSEISPKEHELIAGKFERAPKSIKDQVRHLLQFDNPPPTRENRICLIGLRGAGKTTLGQRVSSHFGVLFVQLNRVIEEQAGMPLTEILALYGQEGFRKLEADALQHVVANHKQVILEASGGIVSDHDTYAMLLQRFHTIWIKAKPEEHMNRVIAQGDTRPMSGNPEAMSQLKQLLKIRDPLYVRAQDMLDTCGQAEELSAKRLTELIRSRSYLFPVGGKNSNRNR